MSDVHSFEPSQPNPLLDVTIPSTETGENMELKHRHKLSAKEKLFLQEELNPESSFINDADLKVLVNDCMGIISNVKANPKLTIQLVDPLPPNSPAASSFASSRSTLAGGDILTTRTASTVTTAVGTPLSTDLELTPEPSPVSTSFSFPQSRISSPTLPEVVEETRANCSRALSQTSEVDADESIVRDIVLPSPDLGLPIPPVKPLHSPEESTAELSATPVTVKDENAPAVGGVEDKQPKTSWWGTFRKAPASPKASAVVVPADAPAVFLPSPPTDAEKVMYSVTRRFPLYLFGTFSFLAVSVGMWFFAISSNMFYWFGVFVGLIQIYLVISYTVGYLGVDFNLEVHNKIVEEHSYPSDKLPAVDIYLPCCHEPIDVLENTYKYVAQLEYAGKMEVYVLDDGGLDTVKALAEKYGFTYITRDNKPHLKKAGNLRYAFARTKGDFFVIYDADFCPRKDFLQETLPYMNSMPDLAILQTPQFFRPCEEQTWVEQGASATQELFYRVVQVNRNRWGASICVGSNAIYRRAALEEVGGTAEIGHSEDVHTGFYALTRGWKLRYIPLALACGVSPDTPRAFFSQQMRWCSGSTTLLTNKDFWKSPLTPIQKICYLSGMMYYTAAAFMAFIASIPGLLMVALNPGMIVWFNFAYALPSLIYSVFVFRLWSRSRYNFNVNFVFTIQQYAYLMALKDRVFGTTAAWVPSGDNSAHVKNKKKKGGNNKYRNMRILCALWMGGSAVGVIIGVTFRILQGYRWYNFIPILLLDSFNLFITHKFIFYAQ